MQKYHSKSKTNETIRQIIQSNKNVTESVTALSLRFNVSRQTIYKWKKRTSLQDVSSKPKNIIYSYSDVQEALIVSIRKSTWFSKENICDMMHDEHNFKTTPSTVYNIFKKHTINQQPNEYKALYKSFKDYEPGYLHIDVTYLPKIEGKKWYLFVAIDRATRTLFYKIYDAKTAANATDFFDQCVNFFLFKIQKVLTDNGLEFTNRLIKSKKNKTCTKPSAFDKKLEENQTEHRLTLPATPQTNGMVERVNHTIKSATLQVKKYTSVKEMEDELNKYLLHYNTQRKHGALYKKTGYKTPLIATQNWFKIKPELFLKNPQDLSTKLLLLQKQIC